MGVRQQDLTLINPVNAQDAVTLAYLQTAINAQGSGRIFKFPVRCAVTSLNASDVVFSSFNSGTNTLTTTGTVTTVDGITLAVNDRILLNGFTSTNKPYNGIYTYTSLTGTAQFTRSSDANTSGASANTDLIVGSAVIVEDGTQNANTEWVLGPPAVGTDTITLNTSNIGWLKPNPANYVPTTYSEVPSGTINGTNMVFTLAHTPVTILGVYLRGLYQPGSGSGASMSWSNSGGTITFNNNSAWLGPQSNDTLYVLYTS